jgi:Holliday junction resolvase RusA-like endonuclease
MWYTVSMRLTIPLKPITNNQLYIYTRNGIRIQSPKYKQFCSDICKLIPRGTYDQENKSEVFVYYIFYISNYANSDTTNHEKAITDMLVQLDYLADDRYIKATFMQKEKVKKGDEKIEVCITNDWNTFIKCIDN